MKFSSLLFSSLLALSVAFTACKKDKKDDPQPNQPTAKTKTELLTGKNWKLTAWTELNGSGGTNNLYDSLTACQKNNLLRFEISKIHQAQDGCTGDFDTDAGSWKFNLTETELQMSERVSWGDSWNVPQKINTLTETTLQLEYAGEIETYTKQ